MTDSMAKVCATCKVSEQVAHELLTLAGGDAELVIRSSKASKNLTECKARIIDSRLYDLELNQKAERIDNVRRGRLGRLLDAIHE